MAFANLIAPNVVKLVNGLSTPGGYFGKNSVASQIGAALGKNNSASSNQGLQGGPYTPPVTNWQDSYEKNTSSQNTTKAQPTKSGQSLYGGRTTPTQSNSINTTAASMQSSAAKAQKAAQRAYQQQRQREIDAINASFQDEQMRLNGLDAQIHDQYGQAQGEFDKYLPQFQGQVANERSTQQGVLDQTELQRKQESNQALAQVRQALAELQRRQQAQLAATGGFNSSALEASGETLSREVFKGLGNVQTQRNNALNDITLQRSKVDDFYNTKLQEGDQRIQQNKASLQQQFMAQLNAITNAKGQSSDAKRQATVDAWRNYTNTATQINQQLVQNKISLDQWAAQANMELQNYGAQQVAQFSQGGINTPTVDASLGGNTQAPADGVVGINAGAYDPNALIGMNVGAYDMNQQYQFGDIAGIDNAPNLVARRLYGNMG